VRRQRDGGARWSRGGYVRHGPHAPWLGARARNAQRDLVVVELVPLDAGFQLSVCAERPRGDGARDRASYLAVRVSYQRTAKSQSAVSCAWSAALLASWMEGSERVTPCLPGRFDCV